MMLMPPLKKRRQPGVCVCRGQGGVVKVEGGRSGDDGGKEFAYCVVKRCIFM